MTKIPSNIIIPEVPPTTHKGYRLEQRDPEKFGKILAMLAAGYSYSAIQKDTGAYWYTIGRIDREYRDTEIAKWKEKAAKEAELASKIVLERIREDLEDDVKMRKTSFKDKTISYAIFKDKEILLKGEATSRTESVQGSSIEMAKAAIEAAREQVKLKRAEESIDI